MLPDLPRLKKELYDFQVDFIGTAIQQELGVFSDCPRHPVFEGDRHGVERATGDTEVNDFNRISAELALKPHEDDLGATFAALYEMGRKMAENFQREAFKYLDKLMEEKGQTVSAKGRPTADALLEMFEKIQIPLGSDGKLDMAGFKVVVGPGSADAMVKAWGELQDNPEKAAKLKEIQERKEAEAHAREANRKLVG